MSESTLRLRTQADVAGVRDMTDAVNKYRDAVIALRAVSGPTGGATDTGGGVATSPGTSGAAPGPTPPPPAAPPPPPPPANPVPAGPGQSQSPAPGPTAPPVPPAPGPPGGGSSQGPTQQSSNVIDRGRQFVSNAASTAIGVGLGNSIEGFLLASGQKYMELSRIINTVGQRFREAGGDAEFFGGRLGYTIAQTSQYMETLGAQTNGVDKGQLGSSMGFGRTMGQDPGAVASMVGRLSRLSGTKVGDDQLAMIAGTAQKQGMDKGRMAEFMQSITQLAEMQFGSTGKVDIGNLMQMQALPSAVFGANDPRGMGDAGVGFTQRLQGVMTGGGAMGNFLMRSMGYGSQGGPGYIEMRKRQEAGLSDPRNLISMFSAFQKMGMGTGAQFRAIESVSGGSLKAEEIEALVKKLGNAQGLSDFQQQGVGGQAAFVASLKGGDAAAFAKGGFAATGARHVDMGSAFSVQTEAMQMSVGAPMARAMLDMRETFGHLIDTLHNITGSNLGDAVVKLSGSVDRFSAFLDKTTQTGGDATRGADFLVHPDKYTTTSPVVGAVQSVIETQETYGTRGVVHTH